MYLIIWTQVKNEAIRKEWWYFVYTSVKVGQFWKWLIIELIGVQR